MFSEDCSTFADVYHVVFEFLEELDVVLPKGLIATANKLAPCESLKGVAEIDLF